MKLVDVLDGLNTGSYKVEVGLNGSYHLLGEEGYSLIHDLAAHVIGFWERNIMDKDLRILHIVLKGSTSTEDMEEAVARYANNDKPWRGILKYEKRELVSIPYLAIVVR